ncbi:MAG: 4-hydroxy-3-methylbut-2-enyl diphosphate reductase [Paludibacteraceae bacterium]|nr:4-hydroxy-3-methylbut-2-enyl diphosphate reductase [Paludibacteraceae bacterium]
MSIQITIDSGSGFCFGVTSAIRKAEEELKKGSLCCLGDIVHNGQEVGRLEQAGLQTIDYTDLRQMHGGRVLLRAHGEPPSTYTTAQQNGIEVIDATCPVVKKLQERIRATYIKHPNAQIVIFGKVGHAEVIGLQGQTNNTAIVVEGLQDIEQLDFNRDIYLFSQTTKSVDEFNQIVDTIKHRLTDSPAHRLTGSPTFEYHDTICRNVANRVAQLKEFASAQHLVVFVGGKKSSNAKVLFEQCRDANPNTIFVSSAEEISERLISDHPATAAAQGDTLRVGICGATSTPLWLMEQVRDRLLDLPINRSTN